MKINELMKLLDAGFSKDEIFSLLGQQNEAPAQEAQQAEPVDDKRLKDIETKLNYVIDRFNYMAVQKSKQPEQDKKETIEDILSNFVK